MANKTEWFSGLPTQFNPDEGDSLHGHYNGQDGELAYTRYGEFGVELSDNGDLIASFPEQGMMYVYDQEGGIVMAVFDVGMYLCSLSYKQLIGMPQEGKQVIDFLEYMDQNKLTMIMTLNFGENESFGMTIVDGEGIAQIEKEIDDLDFSIGVEGDLGLKDHTVAFEVTRYADDLFVAFGERNDKKVSLISTEASLNVQFEDDIFAEDGKRLQRLAGKIILNPA